MARGRLLRSHRGISGGYSLARSPETITIYDIVVVIEGDLIEMNAKPAGRSGGQVAEAWGEIRQAMEDKTRQYTLDSLVSDGDDRMYYI